MKNFFKYVVVMLLVAVPLISFAAEFRGGDQPSVKQDEKIVNDVYMGGGSVSSAGKVEGDLIAGGGNVIVSGDVTGDLIAGGGNVTILSNIGDDVRIAGGTLIVKSKIAGDLMMGGGQINVSGEGVGGDVAIGGGDVQIDAPIAGKLYIAGGNVYINAPVGGDVKIEADKVTLGSKAVITGNFTYKAKKELIQETGAVVNGLVTFDQKMDKKAGKAVFAAIFSAFIIWKFFALLACALVVGILLRRYSMETVSIAINRPFYELGRGLLVVIAMPIISVLLLITFVGIPFGILGLIGFVAMMMFAWITAPIILGSFVYKYFSKGELEVTWKTILLGVFLVTILGFIPFIGWLVCTLLTLLSLGANVALKLQVLKEWR